MILIVRLSLIIEESGTALVRVNCGFQKRSVLVSLIYEAKHWLTGITVSAPQSFSSSVQNEWSPISYVRYKLHFHSFIQAISIAPLLLRRSRYSRYCVRVKDLPKVPTWRLAWDSNLSPSGRKAPNLPMSHYAPQVWETPTKYPCCVGSASR